jgi:uncharacterized protein involved in propanediol utilization
VTIARTDHEMRTTGRGRATGHHGEILQAALEGEQGLRRVLVTLTCRTLQSQATFEPRPGAEISINAHRTKALRAARLTLDAVGQPEVGGDIQVSSNIPWGAGLGSSTADVVGVIRAVNDVYGSPLRATDIAELAVAAEMASDPVMFADQVVLFAQREGRVVEVLGLRLPQVAVLSVEVGQGVDTLQMPLPDYSRAQLETFRVLFGLLRRAVHTQCPSLLGMVATASARINQHFLEKPLFEELVQITERTGGLGVQVAHSGSVVGLMFRCDDQRGLTAAADELVKLSLAPRLLSRGEVA